MSGFLGGGGGGGGGGPSYNIDDYAPKTLLDAYSSIDITYSKTTQSMQWYIDGTSGNDANDGLSAITPKKTWANLLTIIPNSIEHDSSINVSGLLTDNLTFKRTVFANLYIDGGYDNKNILSGPHTCDIASSTSIGLSSLALTTDQYEGYWIEIISGTGAGQRRRIFSHTANTFVPGRNWNTVPVAGSSVFQIISPATGLDGAILLQSVGSGNIVVQNLFLQPNAVSANSFVVFFCENPVILQSCMSNSNATFAAIQARSSRQFSINGAYTNPSTFVSSTFSTHFVGVSVISTRRVLWSATGCGGIFGLSTRSGGISILSSPFTNLGFATGARIRGPCILQNCTNLDASNPIFSVSSGYQVTQFDGVTGVGISLISVTTTMNGIVVKNSTSHGIEIINSVITLTAAVTGTGNGSTSGAGIYAHANSVLYTKAGAAPTIAGNAGIELAVDSPTVQQSTWAAIEAGTPVASANEFTIVKKL